TFMDVLFSNSDGTVYAMGNLLNSYWPFAVLSLTGLAFKNGLFIYIMRQYFNGVPDELEEAAYVDGAGVIKTFARIIIPMAVPMMVTIFMFSFSWQWSEMFYTSLFFTSTKSAILLPNIVKIPVSLDTNYVAQATYETAIRNTCGLLILLPLLILYLFAQRTLIEGVERSGITG
ncbi:MAG: carbohydrate ABC transporter permease, partial [Clostridia bacterium]|nr:carbohydrate ABC transporter permease [Clostridia bacterium]